MLPLPLVLSLLLSIPPTFAFSNDPHNKLAPAHHLFAASSYLSRIPASSLSQESELVVEEDAVDAALCGVNEGPDDCGHEEAEATQGLLVARATTARGIIPNPKKFKVQQSLLSAPPNNDGGASPDGGGGGNNTPTSSPSPTPATTSSRTSTTSTRTSSSVVLSLPTPPSGSCPGQYRDTSSGAVYGPGLGSFPMSPRPSTFVKRSGSKLTLDGKLFRITGPNIYWLGMDENVWPNPAYPSKGRIREAMAITVAMGGNTIRCHTLGASTGTPLSVWPKNGQTNDAAFDSIDYSIWAARNYGLRLLIPLTDNYQYYHGGKFDFIRWAGLSTWEPNLFYTSPTVIKMFKAYISVILNHVNAYTGVAYKDDPTIMAWETGNELGGYFLGGGAPPAAWTRDIAKYIKALAPNHLIADGTDGLVNAGGALATTAFQVDEVDLVTDHFYPAANWLLTKDTGLLVGQYKNFYVGELDWTGTKGGDSLSSFYNQLESMSNSGSMIWSVFGHDDQCCNYVKHNDGYSLYYPNGNDDYLQSMTLLLVQHWHRLRGMTPPKTMPAVACPQPELLP